MGRYDHLHRMGGRGAGFFFGLSALMVFLLGCFDKPTVMESRAGMMKRGDKQKSKAASGDSVLATSAKDAKEGGLSLWEALRRRRSVRAFTSEKISPEQVGQLLWAGQGITSPRGFRTAPSAGATYPIELHVVMEKGVFSYDPKTEALVLLERKDRRMALQKAALNQSCIGAGMLSIVVAGISSRTSWKYGPRTERYVAMEAGAVAQNILLMATALGLGSVLVGAFDDNQVAEIAHLPPESIPYGIIPIGGM